jgi:uncharacterized protein (TIGR02217 family)
MAIVLGSAFGLKKTARFNTILQETSAFQGTVGIALANFPVWDYVLSIPQIQGRLDDVTSPLAQLTGLFFKCRGRAGNFLLQDPDDNQVIAWAYAVGDGVSKTYQLTRPIGSDGIDIVQNWNGAPVLSINGVVTSAYTLSSTGIVTFNTAPANGAVLTVDGNFYFRLRFTEDSMADLTEYFSDRWSISTLNLTSVILPNN